MEFWTKKSLQ